jgi:hypothetical protein
MLKGLCALGASVLVTFSIIVNAQSDLQAEQCFELSQDGVTWSASPPLLCLLQSEQDPLKYSTTLKRVDNEQVQTVARFEFDLLNPEKIDPKAKRSKAKFGIAGADSVLQEFEIRFSGMRNLETQFEAGTVKIAGESLHYRKKM